MLKIATYIDLAAFTFFTNLDDAKLVKKLTKKLYMQKYNVFKPIAFLNAPCNQGIMEEIDDLIDTFRRIVKND